MDNTDIFRILDHNKLLDVMKQCNKCSVDLVLGGNWYASSQKYSQYQCKSCFIKRNYDLYITNNTVEKYKSQTLAGVYGVFNNCKLIYIGQSVKPKNRETLHFSRAGSRGGNIDEAPSKISKALGRGELQRDKLRFKMLEFIDDITTRLAREKCLIQRYKPIYNDLYV